MLQWSICGQNTCEITVISQENVSRVIKKTHTSITGVIFHIFVWCGFLCGSCIYRDFWIYAMEGFTFIFPMMLLCSCSMKLPLPLPVQSKDSLVWIHSFIEWYCGSILDPVKWYRPVFVNTEHQRTNLWVIKCCCLIPFIRESLTAVHRVMTDRLCLPGRINCWECHSTWRTPLKTYGSSQTHASKSYVDAQVYPFMRKFQFGKSIDGMWTTWRQKVEETTRHSWSPGSSEVTDRRDWCRGSMDKHQVHKLTNTADSAHNAART